jgi:hypothetical protein
MPGADPGAVKIPEALKLLHNCSVQVEALAAEVYVPLRSVLSRHPLDV